MHGFDCILCIFDMLETMIKHTKLMFGVMVHLNLMPMFKPSPEPVLKPYLCLYMASLDHNELIAYGYFLKDLAGVYTKFSGRLSEEPFPWLIQKFPCIMIFKTGQPGCQLNLSEGQIMLGLTSGRPLV